MNKFFLLLFAVITAFQLNGQTTVNITDADIQPGMTVNWTNDNVYLLDGLVFVDSSATLNIEAGTVVKFTPRADVDNPSALIVARGGQIFANGTEDAPIIFTAEEDNVNDPFDLGPKDNALWGGVVVLGNAFTEKNGNNEVQVEGIPTTEARGRYGAFSNGNFNDADNSGVLRYVSIRHAGRQLSAGNELNGLSLAAVGSETTLEYIEVYANSDDGIEFFGGSPNLKYAVVAWAEDDSYDWDEVYTGQGQFWFSIQRDDVADSGGELDGTTPDDLTPYSNPTVYNWTHIGSGPGAVASNGRGWYLRAGTAGTIANSMVVSMKNKGLQVQDKDAGVNDAYAKLLGGELHLLNNLFWENGTNTTLDASATGIIRVDGTAEDPTAAALVSHLTSNMNAVDNPELQGISRAQDQGLDPRPAGNTAVNDNLADYPADEFFTGVDYKGAFPPFASGLWIRNWTALDQNNHLADLSNPTVVEVDDNSIQPCDNVTWTADKTYVVDGLTFVDSCATLTIEAGTVVKFTARPDVDNPSALIVARGAQIFANGTADAPIIFTAEEDDIADPFDLGPKDNALWGGVVVLGNAFTEKNGNNEIQVEGIPTTETRGRYGSFSNGDFNDADNSGVMRYVSIRHAGRQLSAGNELNGLSLAAVGSETTLEYIEVYANSDDGIEFFGGSPNLKYAVVAWAEDDSYDWDEVYTGQGQFWFSIQRDDVADSGGELDGTTPDDLTPYSNPTVYNWTHIGSGPGAVASNGRGWYLRAGTAGTIANSMVVSMKNKGLQVQDKDAGVNDAYAKLVAGELNLLNNLFWENGTNTTLDASATGIIRVDGTAEDPNATALVTHLTDNMNAVDDPEIQSISRAQDNMLDPRPAGNTAVNDNLADYPADDFFTGVDYKGAFPPFASGLWIRKWTALEHNAHLADLTNPTVVEVNDNSIQPCDNVTWTADKTYVVDGLTFVDSCATLTIEAGTVVKFTARPDVDNPSALIVARGGKIFANGTAQNPIIFTAEDDDVNDPFDLGPKDNALWGGVVVLGNAFTEKNGNNEIQVEGIPTTEARGRYGSFSNGDFNDADNSGSMRYVSIRHAGRQLSAGNELNGLSLAAVGSGTTLEFIEVYANSDDGIEFFGGSPNLKNAVVAWAEDDSYDWDEVYTGKGQFWFSIQRDDVADSGGELDGTTPDDLTPYSNPTVYNWTHIGSGPGAVASNGRGWYLRAGTAGTIANSIVTEQKDKALQVQNKEAGVNDAYAKLLAGELTLPNNIFYNNGTNTTLDASSTGIIRVSGSAEDPNAQALVDHLVANQTTLFSPYILGISRDQDNGLDPRVCQIGSAYTSPRADVPAGDPFFTEVNYKGAFSSSWNNLWLRGWSTLDRNSHLVTSETMCPSVSTEELAGDLYDVFQIYPNPASGMFIVESSFNQPVNIEIYDMSGRMVANRLNLNSGVEQVSIEELSKGMYMIKFRTEEGKVVTKKLIVQ